MQLKQHIIKRLKSDKRLIAEIAEFRGVGFQTAEKWVNTNHHSLLHIGILNLIACSLNNTIHDLYTL